MHPGSKKMGAALFGQIIGTAPGGVPSYSSDYSSVNYDEFPDRSAFKHFVDGSENTLVETDGRFGHQDYIYQALAPLPNINVQVCSFTAGGYYAGACTRVDESMIITNNSDIFPMRILPDWQWD